MNEQHPPASRIEELTNRLLDTADELRARLEDQIPPKYRGWLSVDDIIQDVWESAYRHHESFVPNGRHSFRKWINRVADNRLLTILRSAQAAKRGYGKAVRPASTLLDLFAASLNPEVTPRTLLSTKEIVDAVQTALPRLGKDTQTAVRLFHFEGLTRAEVADEMGVTTQRAITLLEQGRAELRELLASRFESNDNLLGIAEQPSESCGEKHVKRQRTRPGHRKVS